MKGDDFAPKKEREPLIRQNKNCRVTYTSNPLIRGKCVATPAVSTSQFGSGLGSQNIMRFSCAREAHL